jgi:RHS repeat-associated protein
MNLLLKGNKHPMPMPPMSNDPNSRITGMSNNDGTAAYSYDATDQLTGVDYSYQPDEAYTYDANGNRTNPGYVTGKNNRLLSDGKFNYEYDDEGNVIKQTDILTGEVTAYTWDYRNRLTNVTRNGASVGTYDYDTYDQRIGKTTATGTDRFVYGQNQNIALEFDGSGALTNRYLHGNSIDAIMADEANGSVGWTLTDNLGTVRDVVDGTGSRQNHFVYDSFGNVTSETNSSFDTRFTFTGREFDAETGNYDYRFRPFRPSSGRFIEEDPIRFRSGDMNLYRYVGNNTINFVDPYGLTSQNLRVLLALSKSPKDSKLVYTGYPESPDYSTALIQATNWFYLITIPDSRDQPPINPQTSKLAWVLRGKLRADDPVNTGGKANLRPLSTSLPQMPTIDLKEDDRRKSHQTPGHELVQEVKFRFIGKDTPSKCPVPKPAQEPKLREVIKNIPSTAPYQPPLPEPSPEPAWWQKLIREILRLPPLIS